MRQLLITLTLLITFLLPFHPTSAATATTVVERVLRSTVKVQHPLEDDNAYTCTGVIVAPATALTAQHCITSNELYVNNKPAHLLKVNESLALVSAPEGIPAIEVRKTPLLIGESVTAVGYGWGDLMVFGRNVARLSGPDFVVDGPFAPGQSGGPIVDGSARLVGIVQQANAVVGIACGQDEIRDFIK